MNSRPTKNTRPAPLTWKERFDALRNLPAFFKLVWQTSPWMTIVSAILRIAKSATPLGLLYIGKLIINQILALTHHHDTGIEPVNK